MTIDPDALTALGDNWMVRTDNDGEGYRGFRWAPVGEWTECPKWSDKTTDDCESGGLFGQGGYGGAGGFINEHIDLNPGTWPVVVGVTSMMEATTFVFVASSVGHVSVTSAESATAR